MGTVNENNEVDFDEDLDEDLGEEGEGSEESEDEGSEESGEEGKAEGGVVEEGQVAEGEGSEESAEETEDREAIRERRRQERQQRKQRQHAREENFRRELAARDSVIADMQQQLSLINRKSFTAEVAQLDEAINNAARAYEYYKGQLVDGTKANDGEVVADATEKMYQARAAAEHYGRIKQAIVSQQNKPPAVDTRVQNLAKDWISKNRWYDPSGKNIDSRITKAIDDSLVQEGYDPSTEVYWNELTKRVKKYIPHRANMVYNDNTGDDLGDKPNSGNNAGNKSAPGNKSSKPKTFVTGSGKESSANKGEYVVSAERKKAMQEAGLWDNPKTRAEAIKRYKEYDRTHEKA